MMNTVARPEVGSWYRRLDSDDTFQVVNVDQTSGSVEIQSFGGEIDSIEAEDWAEMEVEATAQPEDWTGALEDVEPDDITEDDSASERG
jgi:hypothetical protein